MTFRRRHFSPTLASVIMVGWMVAGAQGQEAKDPEAAMSGVTPSATLLEQEARALGVLTQTRANLLAAMAADADGPPAPEPSF